MSAETGERAQHQQHYRYVASNSEYHRLSKQKRPITCEAHWHSHMKHLDGDFEENLFYTHFDLLNKESAFEFTPPSEERKLSVSTADIKEIKTPPFGKV